MKKLILIAIAFITFQMSNAQTPDVFPDGIILGSFATDPTGVRPGQLYYNSTDSIVRLYDGLVWKNIGGGIQSVTGSTVDNTDALNPIINAVGKSGTPVNGQLALWLNDNTLIGNSGLNYIGGRLQLGIEDVGQSSNIDLFAGIGGSTAGIRFYNNAGTDTVTDYWSLNTTNSRFRLADNNNNTIFFVGSDATPTDNVFQLPSQTIAKIDAGGVKTVPTKEWVNNAIAAGGGGTPTIQEVLTQGNQISVGTELIFEGSFINSGSSLSNIGGALTANVNEYFSINRGGFELQFNPFVYGIISLDDYSLYTTGVPSTDRLIYAQRGYVDDAIATAGGATPTIDEVLEAGSFAEDKVLSIDNALFTKSMSLSAGSIDFVDFTGFGDTSQLTAGNFDLATENIAINFDGSTGVGTMRFDSGLKLLLDGTTPTVGQVLTVTNVDGSSEWVDGITVDNRILPVVVTDSTYTFLEADLLASKVHLFNVVADTIVATMPTITLPSGEMIVNTIRTINNNNFKIVPDVGINQIEFSPRIKDEAFSVASYFDDVWIKWDNVNSETYVAPPVVETNIILNSTFDNTTNLTLGSAWSVGSGTANFDDSQDANPLTFATSSPITAGNYTLTFDIISGSVPIFSVTVNGVTVIAQATRPVGSYSIPFTYAGADVSAIAIIARNAAGASALEIDNVELNQD